MLRQQVQRGTNLPERRDVLRLQHALRLRRVLRFHLVGEILHDAIVDGLEIAIHEPLREDKQRGLQLLWLILPLHAHFIALENIVVRHGHVDQQLHKLLPLTVSPFPHFLEHAHELEQRILAGDLLLASQRLDLLLGSAQRDDFLLVFAQRRQLLVFLDDRGQPIAMVVQIDRRQVRRRVPQLHQQPHEVFQLRHAHVGLLNGRQHLRFERVHDRVRRILDRAEAAQVAIVVQNHRGRGVVVHCLVVGLQLHAAAHYQHIGELPLQTKREVEEELELLQQTADAHELVHFASISVQITADCVRDRRNHLDPFPKGGHAGFHVTHVLLHVRHPSKHELEGCGQFWMHS